MPSPIAENTKISSRKEITHKGKFNKYVTIASTQIESRKFFVTEKIKNVVLRRS